MDDTFRCRSGNKHAYCKSRTASARLICGTEQGAAYHDLNTPDAIEREKAEQLGNTIPDCTRRMVHKKEGLHHVATLMAR